MIIGLLVVTTLVLLIVLISRASKRAKMDIERGQKTEEPK